MLNLNAVKSQTIRECLQAIEVGDRDGVYKFLRGIGIDPTVGVSASEMIIEQLNRQYDDEALGTAMAAILGGTLIKDMDTAERRLKEATRLVQAAKKSRMDKANGQGEDGAEKAVCEKKVGPADTGRG